MEYFVCADKWFIIQFEEEIDIANNQAHDLSEEGDLKIKHHLQKNSKYSMLRPTKTFKQTQHRLSKIALGITRAVLHRIRGYKDSSKKNNKKRLLEVHENEDEGKR